MAEDNENDVGEDSKEKKKKGIPTVVIIAAVAVLMMAAGVFVGKMMFGGGGNAEEGDKTEVVKKQDGKEGEKKDGENEKKDGEEVNEEDKQNKEENTEDSADDNEKKAEEGKDGEQKDGEHGDKPKEVKKGKGNLKLEEFLINLNDPLVRRYVKFIINLRLTKAAYVDEIKENENIIPEIRDKIFELVSDKSYTDLKSSAGKVMLKEEIMISINEILKDSLEVEPVIKIMFSKFILQ